jgi:hypothetical protein
MFFCFSCKFFPIFGHRNLESGSGFGSVLTKNAGSGSVSGYALKPMLIRNIGCFGAGYELPPDLEDALYTSHLSVPVKERLTSIRNCNLVGAALPVTEPGVSVK